MRSRNGVDMGGRGSVWKKGIEGEEDISRIYYMRREPIFKKKKIKK